MHNLTDAIDVAAGINHSLTLKRDGTVWAWGSNGQGQLGNGTTIESHEPVQVHNLIDVVAIAADEDHSLALKGDGTAWAWGVNYYGQLGDNTTDDRWEPVQVHNLTDVVAIAASEFHSLAVKRDGTVWAWGRNEWGQLGDNTKANSYEPVQVHKLTDVIAIAGAYSHSLALFGKTAFVSVAAEPQGADQQFIVDGLTYSQSHTFMWDAGTTHAVDVASPQPEDAVGTKFLFNAWSDGGDQSHEITASDGLEVTASFDTWHQLTVSVGPAEAEAAGCSVVLDPEGEGDPWYLEGTPVQITAAPAPGWHFVQWDDGETDPVRNITMGGPASYTAEMSRDDLPADLLIKADSENNTAYAENDVYYPEPAGEQIETQMVSDGGAAVYQIKVENDSPVEWSFLLRGGKGNDAGWSVGYLVGPKSITLEITGPDGYATGLLAPGESEVITLVMTPTNYAPVGTSESVTVEVFQESADPTVRDSVEAVAEKVMPLYGDVNGDNCVNVMDLLGVRANLGRGSGCP